MNEITQGTWVTFLKDYQGGKIGDECKVQQNIQGGLYVNNQNGEAIYSLGFLKASGVIGVMKEGNGEYKSTEELAWSHERSSLVLLMLLNGFNYIMCEVAAEDRDFEWIDSLDIVIITGYEEDKFGNYYFVDIEGEYHTAAQPIKPNGDIMGYDDYIKLKQLGGFL